jgi:hypothetical protein
VIKNQLLKIKTDKITVMLVLRSAAGQLQVTLGSARKFLWGSMVTIRNFRKTAVAFPPQTAPLATLSIDVVHLDVSNQF